MTGATSSNHSAKPDLLVEVQVINLGLEEFFDSLKEQEVQVIHVKWSPPAGGDHDTISLLDALF